MANKMLIDAAHPEETRVVVVRGNRVEEFDFESASRRQLRGNIYLAKVTRVEPSLQAAFVDYGGNRHGFLAFSEIHPDYYQIPVADRQALIAAEEREAREADDRAAGGERKRTSRRRAAAEEVAAPERVAGPVAEDTEEAAEEAAAAEAGEEAAAAASGEAGEAAGEATTEPAEERAPPVEAEGDTVEVDSDEQVESVGAVDALEELPERRKTRMRQYKIQEVIKRRQVLLVQVVKEERGNKGAALTTYLSLAGRYSVLMPNTARGGGISRKITSLTDRKRLKQVVSDLQVPDGMGVILRTAGASRTRAEVKRDFEYLMRLWETVRELTLKSTAPALVYEEGSLIKRSIRDLYNKDIDEVVVAGEEAYKEAKDFMRMLMPSHAKNVKIHKDSQPIFARSSIETQLDAMFSPQVTLPSGGYCVINQTEALVSIDVNSGRSTREHSIEDTALQTNLEASDEVARQLRLRDLAGLIVIDFIDMEEKRNNRSVERRLKEALKNDRARIQVGRISHFGLLEMSRQRIRTGVVESTTSLCPTCQGTGHVRSPASVALHVLRALEDQLPKSATHHLTIRTRTTVALYILNQKRAHLSEIEQRFGLSITVLADDAIPPGSHFVVERGEPVERHEAVAATVTPDTVQPDIQVAEETEAAPVVETEPEERPAPELERRSERAEGGRPEGGRTEGGRTEGGRRRRRRRGRGDGEQRLPAATAAPEPESTGEEPAHDQTAAGERRGEDDLARKRRRGRRGGRRGRRGRGGERAETAVTHAGGNGARPGHRNGEAMPAGAAWLTEDEIDTTPQPEPRGTAAHGEAMPAGPSWHDEDEIDTTPRAEAGPDAEAPPAQERQPAAKPETEAEAAPPKRSGWWQRRSFF
jgi:ribonuclease E